MSAQTMAAMCDLNIADMRTPYKDKRAVFDECDLVSKEPVTQFKAWFDEACQTEGILEPNAMALATADKTGHPSVRMVLLKGFDKNGFKFFSNYGSRKGRDLRDNPYCSLVFYWYALKRQVRIEGPVEKLSAEESTEYFHRRPQGSQIGSAISKQSTPVASRQALEDKYNEMEKEYSDGNKMIPKPEFWGGYLVKPELVEFWQGQTNRVHDRIVFRRQRQGEVIDPAVTKTGEDGWVYERLCP
ncbi:pyridoxine/pyridoxamine 5'-phosphate oxidase-like [Liolophura sinensis]|uniref:pyridoxine/pyridoxamine 5'-phosphate oxidase-like n=1 Tax=Liolophura sinensis TaxID=3198878 RepID=UPI00315890A8